MLAIAGTQPGEELIQVPDVSIERGHCEALGFAPHEELFEASLTTCPVEFGDVVNFDGCAKEPKYGRSGLGVLGRMIEREPPDVTLDESRPGGSHEGACFECREARSTGHHGTRRSPSCAGLTISVNGRQSIGPPFATTTLAVHLEAAVNDQDARNYTVRSAERK